MYLYWLDLVGVFAFAYLGARSAIGQKCTLLGAFLCAFLAAVGGGTIRELILNHSPFYLHNMTYLLVIAVAAVLAKISYRQFHLFKIGILFLDAVGMICFALIGARAAEAAQLGLAGVVGFAFLTACGGGILTTIVLRQVPRVFSDSLYALPSIALGITYWFLAKIPSLPNSDVLLLTVMFVAQLYLTANVKDYSTIKSRLISVLRPKTRTVERQYAPEY